MLFLRGRVMVARAIWERSLLPDARKLLSTATVDVLCQFFARFLLPPVCSW